MLRCHVAAAVLGATALIAPPDASAHLVSTRFGELYSGLTHPLTALQHLLPWLGLGLLAGLLVAGTARWAIVVFPLAVGAGALLKGIAPATPSMTPAVLVSLILVGLCVALAPKLRASTFLTIVAAVGFAHGIANGTAELSGGPLLLYVAGVTLSAYAVLTLSGAVANVVARQPGWGTIAVRATGSWIAAVGLVFAGYTLLIAA
ncbi:MAG: HupE/UreJ family protein [Pseudomonadota bacterium]